nr:hypothetical protein [Chloroflexota bacterium]
MQLLHSFSLNLTVEQMLVQQGRAPGVGPAPAEMVRLYQQAIDKAKELAEPVAMYDVFPVRAAQDDGLILADGHVLRSHLVVAQLARAEQIAVAICTIGSRLEEEASRAFAAGQGVMGFLYDSAGSLAVSHMAREVVQQVQERAKQQGQKASFPISPGSADCTLEDQRVVFDLLPAQRIGVRLTDSLLMVPLKSVSLLIGLGRDLPTTHDLAQCDFCERRDKCGHYRLRTMHAFEQNDKDR